MKKIALVGDSFLDKYCLGEVERISPEAPVPILDVGATETRPGGALNVAENLLGLEVEPTVFTIVDENYIKELNFPIISPKNCVSLVKTRFAALRQQLLRVDEPKVYREEDLVNMEYPSFSELNQTDRNVNPEILVTRDQFPITVEVVPKTTLEPVVCCLVSIT